MIRRSPRPDFSFTILRNDVLRDERLSYRARGLLAAMLSFPDNWEFNREWLAKHSGSEGVRAIRTALQEMEAVGYLRRWKTKAEHGRFVWHHVIYDEAPPDVSAGGATGRLATGAQPADGNRPPKEEPSRTTVEEDELNCPSDLRFAPVGASANENPDQDDDAYEDWRPEDRDLFGSVVGERFTSDGSCWTKGTFPGDPIYKAIWKLYRTKDGKRIKWPGRYFSRLDEQGQVEEWLGTQGLETA